MAEPIFQIPPALQPVRILQDKFEGRYSGGRWMAYVDDCDGRDDDVWNGSRGAYCEPGWRQGDSEATVAERFWANTKEKWWVAVGDTPNDALAGLIAKALGRAR